MISNNLNHKHKKQKHKQKYDDDNWGFFFKPAASNLTLEDLNIKFEQIHFICKDSNPKMK